MAASAFNTVVVTSLLCCAPVVPVWGGNSELMADMHDELVQINENVIRSLGAREPGSQISVEARLVEREGATLIVVDQAHVSAAEPSDGGRKPATEDGETDIGAMVFSRCRGDCASTIRAGSFPEDFASRQPAGKNASGVGVDSVSTQGLMKEIDALRARYSGLHARELDAQAIDRLPQVGRGATGRGAILLYW